MVYGITEEFMKLSKKLYPSGHAYIIQQPIVPENPVGPNNKRNIAIGVLFRMVMGMGLVVLKEYMNNTFTDKDELEELLQLSCIGIVPKVLVNARVLMKRRIFI